MYSLCLPTVTQIAENKTIYIYTCVRVCLQVSTVNCSDVFAVKVSVNQLVVRLIILVCYSKNIVFTRFDISI